MNINSLFPRLAVVSALVMAGAVVASGQSYYDDDIYYDASKAPKKEAKQSKQTKSSNRTGNSSTQLYYDGAQYVPWNNVGEYQSADQYQASGTSTRDVDEYNRRYAGVSESRSNEPDSITLQQFEAMSNTRKLARFQNSDVASQAYAQSEYDDAGYYADGYANGYASRLHYISDWVVTNTHRGYIKDVTDRIPQSDVQIKTLDYMSRNRSSYPALGDSATFAGIKDMEVAYRSHRFPYIKSGRLGSKQIINALKGGDIVALTTKTNGLDVSHMGIRVIEKDGPHLLHASSKEGKVVIDRLPLAEYMRKNHQLTGIRVLRLQAQ